MLSLATLAYCSTRYNVQPGVQYSPQISYMRYCGSTCWAITVCETNAFDSVREYLCAVLKPSKEWKKCLK